MNSPFWISLKVVAAALLIVIPIGTCIAWKLATMKPGVICSTFETCVTLPIVLPPTAVGYLLLMLLGRGSGFGKWLNDGLNIHLIFTWQGATIAAAVMSFPLFLRSALIAFRSIDYELLEAARSLGVSGPTVLMKIGIPLGMRGLTSGLALALGRALGEFGATVMVAGNIHGVTQTLPLAIYSKVEGGQDSQAMTYTVLLLGVGIVLLGLAQIFGNTTNTKYIR